MATSAPAETNVALVNAPALWDLGYRGQGDRGREHGHRRRRHPPGPGESLARRHQQLVRPERGASEHADRRERPRHLDHGRDGGRRRRRKLPRGRPGRARGSPSRYSTISGTATLNRHPPRFQWLLDPDGNPSTADAPDVVNDSWTMSTSGCLLDFQPDLANLRAAGILPVFAAGNYGPFSGSSRSPANNPEAFAVGGTDDSDVIYTYSSRGPSPCGQPVYPQLVAPGVGIHTTDLYGLYADPIRHVGRGTACRGCAGSPPAGLPRYVGRPAGGGAGERCGRPRGRGRGQHLRLWPARRPRRLSVARHIRRTSPRACPRPRPARPPVVLSHTASRSRR